MAGQKVEICLKKNPPRAQKFRNFRYESRNKKRQIIYEQKQQDSLVIFNH